MRPYPIEISLNFADRQSISDTHHKKAPHLAGKAAEHQHDLQAQLEVYRQNVAVCGLVVSMVKGARDECFEEMGDLRKEAVGWVEEHCEDDPEKISKLTEQIDMLIVALETDIA